MKNIIKGALLLLMLSGVVSCSLDKEPSYALPKDEGIVSYEGAEEFRNSLYAFTRGCFPPDAFLIPGFQSEGINATRDYGNQYGPFYNWTFDDSTSELGGLWASCYGAIFQINYFLENVEKLDQTKWTGEQKGRMKLYKGEAYFFRAMINRLLTTFYCKAYDPATAATDLGVIISTKADVEARLERSTLLKTFEAITEDLSIAQTAIEDYYKDKSKGDDATPYYINPMTVKALKAQVALDMRNYPEAATLSAEIVSQYALINNTSDFQKLWSEDTGSEIVFQFFANVNEGAASFGSMFLRDPDGTNGVTINPAYIPDAWIMNEYDSRDIRKGVYFKKVGMRIGNTKHSNIYAVTKYPGNKAYNSGRTNELKHNVRPFRSADFCLMAAEAYAMSNDEVNANTYLNMLLSARIPGYTAVDRPVDEVMSMVKTERLKELYMEGNRIYDLRRWGNQMTRAGHVPQEASAVIPSVSNEITIPVGDPRFIWPLPQSETSGNPNVDK